MDESTSDRSSCGKGGRGKAQRLKEEANEATVRADEFDAKCRAAIQSAASSYDKFMHDSQGVSLIFSERMQVWSRNLMR